MNNVIFGYKFGRYLCEDIQCAKGDIGRQPSLWRTLTKTNVQAIETGSGWKLLGEFKEPNAAASWLTLCATCDEREEQRGRVLPRPSRYVSNAGICRQRRYTGVKMET